MSFLVRTIFGFLIFFAIAILCCINGDDDVVYKFHDRKPTPAESIARLRYVLAKGISSLYAGVLLATFVGKLVLEKTLSVPVSKNQAILMALAFCFFFSVCVMGAIQNLIRYFQQRPQRPLIDKHVLKILYLQWSRRQS